MIKTTNTNPWGSRHFRLSGVPTYWVFFCSLSFRICYVKSKNTILAGLIYFPCLPHGPRILKAADGPSPWRWPTIKFAIIERFPLMTPSSVAMMCKCSWTFFFFFFLTTSEALVRKALLPTLHLCFKGILTDGFYYLIVFWTFVDSHRRPWGVKAQQRFTKEQLNANAVTCF